jgi:DNA-binding NarL/FixJ family response regulator
LTPSERRVVELAAAGGTNREIAQTLFVTEKTVETHLGWAFRKLNIPRGDSFQMCSPTPLANPSRASEAGYAAEPETLS